MDSAIDPSGQLLYVLPHHPVPENYLLCDGREIRRSEYPNLFAVIGTRFGEGDGKTTFNLPELDQVATHLAAVSDGHRLTFGRWYVHM